MSKRLDSVKGDAHDELKRESVVPFGSGFSSLFSCPAHSFAVLVRSPSSHSVAYGCSRQLFREKALKTHCAPPAQHQTADRQTDRLAGEHSGAFW